MYFETYQSYNILKAENPRDAVEKTLEEFGIDCSLEQLEDTLFKCIERTEDGVIIRKMHLRATKIDKDTYVVLLI